MLMLTNCDIKKLLPFLTCSNKLLRHIAKVCAIKEAKLHLHLRNSVNRENVVLMRPLEVNAVIFDELLPQDHRIKRLGVF